MGIRLNKVTYFGKMLLGKLICGIFVCEKLVAPFNNTHNRADILLGKRVSFFQPILLFLSPK